MELDLNEIRKNIDTIDTEMTRLFEERMKLTYQVAAYKIENGKKVYDKEREDSKLEHLSGLTEDSFYHTCGHFLDDVNGVVEIKLVHNRLKFTVAEAFYEIFLHICF